MALELEYLRADTIDTNSVTLNWKFKDTTEDLSIYSLELYRSEAPISDSLDGYDLVTTLTMNEFVYIDAHSENIYDPNRKWYYKLKIINNSTGETSHVPTTPAYLNKGFVDPRQRYAYNYILRWKGIALKQFSGRDFYLLKRRTWGERCEEHWDSVLQRSTTDKNTIECRCYGTGYIDGYFNPIKFTGMATSKPSIDQISQFGEFKPGDSLLYLLNFPVISPKDIIVFCNRPDRFYINQVNYVNKYGKVIEQQARLSLIHPDDITYRIEVEK